MTSAPPKHRIGRTAVRTVAGCVLFLAWYVGSWLGYSWLTSRGTIRWATFEPAYHVVFGPINGYVISGYPGADGLEILRRQCQALGSRARYRGVSLPKHNDNSTPAVTEKQP